MDPTLSLHSLSKKNHYSPFYGFDHLKQVTTNCSNSVSIEIRLWAVSTTNCNLFPGRGKKFLSFLNNPDRPWDPPNLLILLSGDPYPEIK
jgi:hypothetical protein